jgi:Rrf2 family cysteine metabolism transcriptional repressor
MRISKKAEYACFAMLELAANYRQPQPIRLKVIADAHGIPQRFLVQILLQLKGTGLVASSRGAAGGYQLARSPEQISLAEVINAIDRAPEPRVARNRKEASASPAGSPTLLTLQAVWKEIDAQEQRLLEGLSLSELVRRSQQHEAASYQI